VLLTSQFILTHIIHYIHAAAAAALDKTVFRMLFCFINFMKRERNKTKFIDYLTHSALLIRLYDAIFRIMRATMKKFDIKTAVPLV